MDKFLKNYVAIGILSIFFAIFVFIYKFNPTLLRNIPIFSSSSNFYKQTCINYVTSYLDVNYNKKISFTKKAINAASVKRNFVIAKNRTNLSDNDKNKIKIVTITKLKANIDNNLSYNVICWINANYKDDPENITSYDILKLEISKSNDKSSFKIIDNNY